MPYAVAMDERAARQRDDRSVVAGDTSAVPRPSRTRRRIDGPSAAASVDLADVLRQVADRVDQLFDEGARSATHAEGPTERAVDAWSAALGSAADDDAAARRHALGTTVLRMSANGLVDVVPQNDASAEPEAEAAPSKIVVARGGVAEPSGDVDQRLRSVRERLAQRRAQVVVDEEARSAPLWRQIDARKVTQRVVIATSIVVVSALVAVLLT